MQDVQIVAFNQWQNIFVRIRLMSEFHVVLIV